MHSAKVAAKIRAQIRQFSGEVPMGLPKTAARLVREVICGAQSRASVRLNEIARALEERLSHAIPWRQWRLAAAVTRSPRLVIQTAPFKRRSSSLG